MSAAPLVGVVIVSYNTAPLLQACLISLRHCQLPLQVVIVDNGSHDASVAVARAAWPSATIIEAKANLGFAAANNRGLAALGVSANGQPSAETPEYLLLLNPDTEVRLGAIEALVAFLSAHPRVGMVGPRLLNPDLSRQTAAFRFPTPLMTALDLFPPGEVLPGRLYNSWWHGRYPEEVGDAPFAIDHPLGACMLVRRAAIAAAGLLDPGFFMYSEEVEWAWRIRRAGYAIWQQPAAEVIHVGGAATSQFRWRMLVELYRARERYFARCASPSAHRAHRLIVKLGMLRFVLRSWLAFARRRLSHDDLCHHLLAYGLISQL